MKTHLCKIAVITCSLSLLSCASILSKKSQSVSVDTGDAQDVSCELFNGKGRYLVKSPGTVVISQSCDDLNYICRKEGYNTINGKIAFTYKGTTAGNIILGGGIGYMVDVGTGAACKYPESISLPMTQINF